MEDNIPLALLLQVVLVLLNGIFACLEIAVISFNDAKLAHMAEEGNKKALRLKRLTQEPAKFLSTIQVAITLSGFLASAFAADSLSGPLAEWFSSLGIGLSVQTLDTLCVILITLILSYFTLVFGELVPKRIGMRNAEKLSLGMSGFVSAMAKLFAPIVWLLTVSTNAVLRLIGIDPQQEEDEVTEEEIRMMVDVGSEKGTIDVDEKEMIQNVFEFDDTSAEDMMTRRMDVTVLWLEESVEEWDETIRHSTHTLYPICDETVDDIVGILNSKDYFRSEDKSKEAILASCVKSPYFVPETVKADVLFANMKKTKNSFAVVVDEYGATSGIVTLNDVIEEIVGDLEEDDVADALPMVKKIGENAWRMQGICPTEIAEEALGITLPEGEYDTIGGLVLDIVGEMPAPYDEVELDDLGLMFTVETIKNSRIGALRATFKTPKTEDDPSEEMHD